MSEIRSACVECLHFWKCGEPANDLLAFIGPNRSVPLNDRSPGCSFRSGKWLDPRLSETGSTFSVSRSNQTSAHRRFHRKASLVQRHAREIPDCIKQREVFLCFWNSGDFERYHGGMSGSNGKSLDLRIPVRDRKQILWICRHAFPSRFFHFRSTRGFGPAFP